MRHFLPSSSANSTPHKQYFRTPFNMLIEETHQDVATQAGGDMREHWL